MLTVYARFHVLARLGYRTSLADHPLRKTRAALFERHTHRAIVSQVYGHEALRPSGRKTYDPLQCPALFFCSTGTSPPLWIIFERFVHSLHDVLQSVHCLAISHECPHDIVAFIHFHRLLR